VLPQKNKKISETAVNLKKVKNTADHDLKHTSQSLLSHVHRFVVSRWRRILVVRREVTLWVIIIGLIVAFAGIQEIWYRNAYMETIGDYGGTYAEAVLGPTSNLDPLFASSNAEKDLSKLLFSSLLKYDSTGHIGYDLANNIDIKDNNYDVTIRDDAYWQDGKKLNADDIIFTANLLKDSSVNSVYSGWNNINIKKTGDYSVRFTLPNVYAPFKDALTFPILPYHILKNVSHNQLRENSFSNNPIGSGPFKFTFEQVSTSNNESSSQIIYLNANSDYYGGRPNVNKFQLHVYNTQDDIIKALNNGEVNAAADISNSQYQKVSSNFNKIASPISSGVYAIINTTSDILSDTQVRKALQYDTDTSNLRKILNGKYNDLYSPFYNGQISQNDVDRPQYNSTTAAKILDDDGWKLNNHNIREKDGKQLKLSLVTISSDDYDKVVNFLNNSWSKIGIELNVTKVNGSASQNFVQNFLQPRSYDILIYQLSLGSDPDVYAYWNSSQVSATGYNFSNYKSPIVDDILVSARGNLDERLRSAKYALFVKQWLKDVPAIGLYQSNAYYAYAKTVNSYDSSRTFITSDDRYNDVVNWSAATHSVYKTP
jgi:peptide/nickel transport system substrate-binding protein